MLGNFLDLFLLVCLAFYPVDLGENSLGEISFSLTENEVTLDSMGKCTDLKYDYSDFYVAINAAFECDSFAKEGLVDEGPWYSFNKENNNDLSDYKVVYESDLVRVYEFVNYESLEGHVFGEVYFKVCENLAYDYFLHETHSVVDENLNLKIDISSYMDLDEFVGVCRSLEIL